LYKLIDFAAVNVPVRLVGNVISYVYDVTIAETQSTIFEDSSSTTLNPVIQQAGLVEGSQSRGIPISEISFSVQTETISLRIHSVEIDKTTNNSFTTRNTFNLCYSSNTMDNGANFVFDHGLL
jgi:hypothetical protein